MYPTGRTYPSLRHTFSIENPMVATIAQLPTSTALASVRNPLRRLARARVAPVNIFPRNTGQDTDSDN